MAWIEPLDLRTIFVNVLAGSNDIFVGLALMTLAGMAAYFRMTNEVSFLLIGLFFVIMSPLIGNGYMLVFILIATLLTYFAISKLFK